MCIHPECFTPQHRIMACGMCTTCYQREYYRNNPRQQELAKARNRKRYANPELRQRMLDYEKSPEVKVRKNEAAKRRRKTPEGKERAWERNATTSHGITRPQRDELLKKQNYCCPVCEQPLLDREAVVDHDHACCPGRKRCGTCVRGLLHSYCNFVLVHVVEYKPEKLVLAKKYLDAWKRRKLGGE